MQLNPYLTFNGNCEEAFRFYAQCLRGELALVQRFGDTPGLRGHAGHASRQDHARASAARRPGADGFGQPSGLSFEGIKGCSIALSVEQPDEADRIFNELAQGGVVVMPMQETFWAKRFGMVNDRFGVPWMINGAMQQ